MGGGRGAHDPVKFGKKYFSGSYYVKFGHFSGKNHVKFGMVQANILKIRVF